MLFFKRKKITYPSCCQIFKSSQFLAFTQSSRTSAGWALPGSASAHMRAAQPPAAAGLDPLSAAATCGCAGREQEGSRTSQTGAGHRSPIPAGLRGAGVGHGLLLSSSSWHQLGQFCLHKLGTSLANLLPVSFSHLPLHSFETLLILARRLQRRSSSSGHKFEALLL